MSVREGYKQTEIGLIPEEWEVKRIEEIAEVKGGKRLPKGSSLSEEKTPYPYIRVTDMYMGGINSTGILYVPIDIQPQIKNYTISKDDLFISVAGTLGLVGDVPPELHNANLTENADKITNIQANKKYLLYVLLSDLIQNEINKQTTSNAQPKLALTRIKTFQIPFPSLPEQQKIAEILSTVDQKIDSIDSKIEETQTLKRGLMQRLLSEGIGHSEFKESEIGRIPTGWEVVQLEDIASFKNGKGHEQFIDDNGEFIVINSKFISTDGSVYKSSNENLSPLHVGEITMVMSDIPNGRALAKCFLIKENHKYTLNQRICSLSPKKDDSLFLYYILSRNPYFLKFNDGVNQTNLRKNEVIECKIPLPPLEEQKQIAEILSTTDEKLETLRAKKEAFETLKKGLMQKLLSGEVRVNG